MSKRITVLLSMVGLLVAFVTGVALAKAVTCTGGLCEGTNQEDTITGSPNNDTIIAKKGNDTVTSNQGGQDTVKGGRGNDLINVQDGAGGDFANCSKGKGDTAIIDGSLSDPERRDTWWGCEEITVVGDLPL
jgi:Ca2+-binding RTX toxin-like protein